MQLSATLNCNSEDTSIKNVFHCATGGMPSLLVSSRTSFSLSVSEIAVYCIIKTLFSKVSSIKFCCHVSVTAYIPLPQGSVSLCDSLQSSGQRGQTLGLSWWTNSATGPSSGHNRPQIPENTCPDHIKVRQTQLTSSGVVSQESDTDLTFFDGYFLVPLAGGTCRGVSCASPRVWRPPGSSRTCRCLTFPCQKMTWNW